MTTERELRQQEEEAQRILDEERNPHSWKRDKWVIFVLVAICGIGLLLL